MKITAYEQLTPLDLRRDIEGPGKLFQLSKRFEVRFKTDASDEWIHYQVPAGYYTDLASIPSVVPKWIAQKVDRHIEAAVVHDYMYESASHPKELADSLFLFVMKSDGVPAWRRVLMYNAVKFFGKGAWKD